MKCSLKDFNNFLDLGTYHDPENDVLSAHLFMHEGKSSSVQKFSTQIEFNVHQWEDEDHWIFLKGFGKFSQRVVNERVGYRYQESVHTFRCRRNRLLWLRHRLQCNEGWKFWNVKNGKFIWNLWRWSWRQTTWPSSSCVLSDKLTASVKTMKSTANALDANSKARKVKRSRKWSCRANDLQWRSCAIIWASKNFEMLTIKLIDGPISYILCSIFWDELQMTLYELSYRHEIQDKLRNEITRVLTKHNDEINYEALAVTSYLEQVINGV